MNLLVGVFRGWLSQDVARRNAAQAAVRLQHRRRELDDVYAFLAAHAHHPTRSESIGSRSTDVVHVLRPAPGPL